MWSLLIFKGFFYPFLEKLFSPGSIFLENVLDWSPYLSNFPVLIVFWLLIFSFHIFNFRLHFIENFFHYSSHFLLLALNGELCFTCLTAGTEPLIFFCVHKSSILVLLTLHSKTRSWRLCPHSFYCFTRMWCFSTSSFTINFMIILFLVLNNISALQERH